MAVTPIAAVLIARNEEEKVGRALQSLLQVADQIVVLDSGSTDRTEEICRRHGARFQHQDWLGYRDQKQKATDLADFDWVLSLDADEVLSPDLRTEILAWKEKEPQAPGYLIPRKTFFMGRWIVHTSWYPDWQLRLFDRRQGSWSGNRVHESFKVKGAPGRFQGFLEHYTYRNFSEYLVQLESFTSLAAADAFDAGKRSGWFKLLTLPPLVFLQNYLLKRGFLDGLPGFTVSSLAACSVFFRYLKLYELQRRNEAGP